MFEFDAEIELVEPVLPETLFDDTVPELNFDDISDEIEFEDVDELEYEYEEDSEYKGDVFEIFDSFEACPVVPGILSHEITNKENRTETTVINNSILLFEGKQILVILSIIAFLSILFAKKLLLITQLFLNSLFFK